MNGTWVDRLRLQHRRPSLRVSGNWPPGTRMIELANARVRVRDSGSGRDVIVLAPDAPIVLENYDPLIERLSPHARVICVEFPGCGYSVPKWNYGFALDDQVSVIAQVLDALSVEAAVLALTCVNAFAALAFAQRYPQRTRALALAQVGDIGAMTAFMNRIDLRVAGVSLLRTPILGQAFISLAAASTAKRWIDAAIPSDKVRDAVWMQSRPVFSSGGEFCLASIVQGLKGTSEEQLRLTSVPVTVTWGTHDPTHRRTDKSSLKNICPCAQINLLEGLGHCPDIEAPDLYADLLLQHVRPQPT